MCSSTRAHPQKMTKFWQIYKASYSLFIGIWQGMTLVSWMCFVLSLGKSSHISPSYSLQKNCCFHTLSKDSLEHCAEIPEDHLCSEPRWKAAGSQGLAGWTQAAEGQHQALPCCPCSSYRCPEGERKRNQQQQGEGKWGRSQTSFKREVSRIQ